MNSPEPEYVTEEIPLVRGEGSARVCGSVNPYAASLRQLVVDGVNLVQPYAPGIPPLSAGVVLVPWPNRVDGGRWMLDGAPQQLPINEPDFNNANNGLLSTTEYASRRHGSSSVTLTAGTAAQTGYPFDLDTSVTYSLTANGITVLHEVRNRSTVSAPVAVGAHPYLRLGCTPTADLTVTVTAATYLPLDSRHLPAGRSSVTGTALDLRMGRRVGDTVTHAAFADLERVGDRIEHTLRNAEGDEVVLWADGAFLYAQMYITTEFPGLDGETTAIALEPMTAPPNALASGEGMRWVAPGEMWSLAWGIEYRRVSGAVPIGA